MCFGSYLFPAGVATYGHTPPRPYCLQICMYNVHMYWVICIFFDYTIVSSKLDHADLNSLIWSFVMRLLMVECIHFFSFYWCFGIILQTRYAQMWFILQNKPHLSICTCNLHAYISFAFKRKVDVSKGHMAFDSSGCNSLDPLLSALANESSKIIVKSVWVTPKL